VDSYRKKTRRRKTTEHEKEEWNSEELRELHPGGTKCSRDQSRSRGRRSGKFTEGGPWPKSTTMEEKSKKKPPLYVCWEYKKNSGRRQNNKRGSYEGKDLKFQREGPGKISYGPWTGVKKRQDTNKELEMGGRKKKSTGKGSTKIKGGGGWRVMERRTRGSKHRGPEEALREQPKNIKLGKMDPQEMRWKEV